ncbi:hypothetical protein DICPUDRAFT_151413 [Dictyostelium purpureum]|uniref:Uncharacterized protein n=1 Tax=Dictyostelium purpureum TaxID=5786 RepID=F0ZIS0_DICPU|nr:uncharacterized protein DICPUDRAFT_151413 [Dictyostelium purpureum]EGC36172.1 hypothetical protein DICPUDRAFT_151413 [Dictyostelium purpureum]|eukprot:XP_003287305.1 hypothetical protein DICPUDRAFT_151413 [Dictyostelium purpureum]
MSINNINLDGLLKLDENNNLLKSNKYTHHYSQNHIVDFLSDENKSLLKHIVKKNENNIVGISYGNGMPFSSGLLLNDRYVLTFSNVAGDESFDELNVRLNYQKEIALRPFSNNLTELMDFGQAIPIDGIVETNSEIGFSILKLKYNTPSFNRVNVSNKKHKQSKLKLLFNFENNGPKKVALINHEEHIKLSNGVYFDDAGHFIGLLNDHFEFISADDIKENSKFFEMILDNHELDSIKTEKRLRHHPLHKSKRPRYPGPNLPNPHNPPLARHHIIPYGSMDALWQLSLEYPKIKELFYFINKEPTHQYVVWSYWNIFAGPNPSLRFHKDELEKIFGEGTLGYDPEDSVEPLKPDSFNQTQWNIMHKLNDLLESTYLHRSKLLSTSSLYRKNNQQKLLYETNLVEYKEKLEQIFNLLNQNRMFLSEIGALHDYNIDDWAKYEKKYYLLSPRSYRDY